MSIHNNVNQANSGSLTNKVDAKPQAQNVKSAQNHNNNAQNNNSPESSTSPSPFASVAKNMSKFQYPNNNPVDGHTGMSHETRAHYDDVAAKMHNYVQEHFPKKEPEKTEKPNIIEEFRNLFKPKT